MKSPNRLWLVVALVVNKQVSCATGSITLKCMELIDTKEKEILNDPENAFRISTTFSWIRVGMKGSCWLQIGGVCVCSNDRRQQTTNEVVVARGNAETSSSLELSECALYSAYCLNKICLINSRFDRA